MTNTIRVQLLHNLLDEVSTRYDYLYDANLDALEKIKYSAFHDPLTGLANRVAFEENLERSISAAKRHGGIGAVLFMDLDNFKLVNDTVGHEGGINFYLMWQIKLSDNFERKIFLPVLVAMNLLY
jgi:GGDEF domain-containing protein